MNKRIQKKKAKLTALHASRWKYVKIAEKRRHEVGIYTEQFWNHLSPRTDAWPRKLRMKRRLGKAYPEYAHKRLRQLCMSIFRDTDDLQQVEYHYFRKAESVERRDVAKRILSGYLNAKDIGTCPKFKWLHTSDE